MKAGVNDLVCHPGYFPKASGCRQWNYGWEAELNALRDVEVITLMKAQKIRLGNYAL
jgi:hypothetical protein